MKPLSFLLAGLAILLPFTPAPACPIVRSYRPSYVAPVYETPVIVTPAIVTQLVAIPTYSAAYVAPVAPAVAPAAAPVPSACESRLQALTDRLAALEARQGPVDSTLPPPAPKADSASGGGLAVFQNRCASCHDAAKLKANQPAFRKDGQLIAVDCLTALDCVLAVGKGTMPPAGKEFTAQESADLIEWLKVQAHNQKK
jgi:mono/diheme cytochrome c family protein